VPLVAAPAGAPSPIEDPIEATEAAPSRLRYRAVLEAALWRRWGEEMAVYEGRSARTHLLADGHAELFGLLAARPEALTLREIAREFEGEQDAPLQMPLSPAELASLEGLLGELVQLGLLEAVAEAEAGA
jgi:hypothetical protein